VTPSAAHPARRNLEQTMLVMEELKAALEGRKIVEVTSCELSGFGGDTFYAGVAELKLDDGSTVTLSGTCTEEIAITITPAEAPK
jgi:hypothetical protein